MKRALVLGQGAIIRALTGIRHIGSVLLLKAMFVVKFVILSG